MKRAQANAIVSAIADWAIVHDDIRAIALAGSWARARAALSGPRDDADCATPA